MHVAGIVWDAHQITKLIDLGKSDTKIPFITPLLPVSTFHSLLALYTKLLAGKCLIHIGREGSLNWTSLRITLPLLIGDV